MLNVKHVYCIFLYCKEKLFVAKLRIKKVQNLRRHGHRLKISELLAERDAEAARDFFGTWEEERTGAWANAHKQANDRAASDGHLPQLRGQLRHHLGEQALRNAAQKTGHGAISMETVLPGARFILARIGRFGLVSVKADNCQQLPRRSATRNLLSAANEALDPQCDLFSDELSESRRGATELAYLGCLVTIPCSADPSVPAEFFLAIPKPNMAGWINTISISRLHGLLLDAASVGGKDSLPSKTVLQDKAFPQIPLPKVDKANGKDGQE